MKKCIRIFLILILVIQSVALELLRHNHLNLIQSGCTVVSTNNGDAATHLVPLDSVHPCIACIFSSLRISTPATAFEFSPSRLFLANIIFQNESLIESAVSISGARSPPNSII